MPTLRQMVYGSNSTSYVDDLVEAARASARWRQERAERRKRRVRHAPALPVRGGTLRPGPETPLWNELVRQIRPHLRRYGAKAQLARLLGLPRQRLQECLKAKSACLDAERALLLVGWLGFFHRGGEIIPVVRPGRPRGKSKVAVPGNV